MSSLSHNNHQYVLTSTDDADDENITEVSGGYFSRKTTTAPTYENKQLDGSLRGEMLDTIHDNDDDDEEDSIDSDEEEFGDLDIKYARWKLWFIFIIHTSCVVSVFSVCLNTPQTFKLYPLLREVTITLDVITGFVLVCEAVVKMKYKGFVQTMRNTGRTFELVMVLCILLSICIQAYERTYSISEIEQQINNSYLKISFVRAPRPLLLFRAVNSLLNVSLPKTVSYRSLKQIWGVLMFTLYFFILAAILGIQMFGVTYFYCVNNSTDLENVLQTDLLLPVTRCPPPGYQESKFRCPNGFMCASLKTIKNAANLPEPFNNIVNGFLTIYETSTMEGWSSTMYDIRDVRSPELGAFYSITIIILITFLVKNVFVAIVTETFTELRLQVSKLHAHSTQQQMGTVLRKSHNSWNLVNEDSALIQLDRKRQLALMITENTVYRLFVVFCIVTDAICQLFASHNSFCKYAQIVYTLFFLSETLLKFYGLGMNRFFKENSCIFEFGISIGSTLFLTPVLMGRHAFVVFQVVRPFRLVVMSSALQRFLRRILGNGRKLGHLILFTLFSLVIAAGVSLQLFCGMGLPWHAEDEYNFATFPLAFKALYQIFMTEGWVEVMTDTLHRGGSGYEALVFIMFVLFHLIGATILVSVFVALILDNLQLAEDVKIAKQRLLGDEVADTHNLLPLRMRLYQSMTARPTLTRIKVDTEVMPKLRQSFVNRYIDIDDEEDTTSASFLPYSTTSDCSDGTKTFHKEVPINHTDYQPLSPSSLAPYRKRSSVYNFMQHQHSGKCKESITTGASENKSKGNFVKRPSQRAFQHHFSTRVGTKYANTSPSTATFAKRLIINTPALKMDKQKHAHPPNTHLNRTITSTNADLKTVRRKIEEAQRTKETLIENIRENHPLFDSSLFIFSMNNGIREFARKVVHTRYNPQSETKTTGHTGGFSVERLKQYFATQTLLDWCMLFCTQLSIFAIFVETSHYRTFNEPILSFTEHFYVVVSTIELALKIVADGLILTPNAFIRNFSNNLHVFSYAVSLIYIIWKPDPITPGSAAQYILILRGLRPLRLIALTPGFRKVVNNLVNGYKSIMKVMLLEISLMFVFASFGVQFLGGRLKKCNDPAITSETNCSGVFHIKVGNADDFGDLHGEQPAILAPRVWRNPRSFHFDDLGAALAALLEIQSLEGWTEVRDILEEVDPLGSLYVHLYVFIASLIGLTLFVGVVVSNFNENKGTALLTVEQKRWKDLKKRLGLTQPIRLPHRPPVESLRNKLFSFLIGKHYHRLYTVLVLLNSATLCTGQWVPAVRDYTNSLMYVAMLCCFLFVVDTLVKIYTFTWKGYWWSWRNRFDFMLTIGGLVFTFWSLVSCHSVYKNKPSCEVSMHFGVTIFILRFISLSGKHNLLRMLTMTVVISLIKSFYTLGTIVIMMVSYAIVGNIVFGSVKPGLAINRRVNFKTTFNAFLLLFKMATGEDWNKILHDAKLGKPYCSLKVDENYWLSNCGNPWFAMLYFHSYYLLVTYIFLNLFIAVVIENFSIFYSTDDNPIMSQQDIQCYQETWNVCDVEQDGSMSLIRAKVVLRFLQGSLSLDHLRKGKPLIFRRMVAELEKVKTTKNVTFHNLLFVLAHNKIDIASSLQLEERLEREELEIAILKEVAMDTIEDWITRVVLKKRVNEKDERETITTSSEDDWDTSSMSSEDEDSRISWWYTSMTSNSSYEALNYEPPFSSALNQRRATLNYIRQNSVDFYRWWRDELENIPDEDTAEEGFAISTECTSA